MSHHNRLEESPPRWYPIRVLTHIHEWRSLRGGGSSYRRTIRNLDQMILAFQVGGCPLLGVYVSAWYLRPLKSIGRLLRILRPGAGLRTKLISYCLICSYHSGREIFQTSRTGLSAWAVRYRNSSAPLKTVCATYLHFHLLEVPP